MKMTLKQTMLWFLILSVLIFSFSALVLYYQFSQSALRQEESYTIGTLSQSVARIESTTGNISESMRELAGESVLASFGDMTAAQRYQAKDYVATILNTFPLFQKGALGIKLHMAGHSGMFSSNTHSTLSDSSLYMAYDAIIAEYLLEETFMNAVVTGIYTIEQRQIFGIAVPVFSSSVIRSSLTYKGCLLAIFDLEAFEDLLPLSATPCALIKGEDVVLTNGGLSQAQMRRIAQGATDGNGYVVFQDLSALGLRACAVASGTVVREQVDSLRRYCIVMICVLVAVQTLLMMLLHLKITRPIVDIARQTRQVGCTDKRIQNPDKSRNELDILTNGMNDMVRRVEQLTRQAAEAENHYLCERVMFLQTQINPHFLFNNLECVRGMAAMGDTKSIGKMLASIASIYRYCVHNQGAVTLRDEMDCLHEYMTIMELRYQNGFVLQTDVTAEALERKMPSMLLQPLAENAIRHGFLSAGLKKGTLSVRAREAGSEGVVVELENDGAPISQDTMKLLNEGELVLNSAQPHIGVANMQGRIALICGAGSGLTYLYSSSGHTVARVAIDCMLEKVHVIKAD